MNYSKELTAFAAGLFIATLIFNASSITDQSFSGARNASTDIVAVSENGEGVIGDLKVEIAPGNGEVQVEKDPFVGNTTQFSAETAKKVAEKVTNTGLDNKDVFYKFDIKGNLTESQSIGAAMTLATIAAIEDRKISEKVAVTGTIRPDGRIGRVGEVLEKSYTTGENGIKQFYVPRGQENLTYYTRVVTEDVFYPGLLSVKDVEYKPDKVSLGKLTREKHGMNVTEVSSIEELQGLTLD